MLVLGSILVLVGCGGGGGGSAVKEVFTISYNGNGAESGVAPAKQSGDEDSPLSVQANTGNLVKSGYLFDGWNTSADGSGTSYTPGASYKGKNVTLYAKWAAIFNVQVINPGSPAPALNGAQQRAPGVPYIKILSLTARGKTLASIIIPEAIDGYQVVAIGAGAFQNCDAVTELSIPNTVTSIGDNAFTGCTGISTLTIPSGVTSIGSGTFSGCAGLNSIVLLTATPPALGTGALEGCTAIVSVPVEGVDDYKAAGGWNTYSASIAGYSTEIYTVTFDGQGATTAPGFTSKEIVPPAVTVGQLPTPPAKTGYNFGGWYKEAGGAGGAGGEFTAGTVVSANITVYAKWDEYNYTVTFNGDGANILPDPTSKPVNSPNTTVGTLPTAPKKDGFYFCGWFSEQNGEGSEFTKDTVVTRDMTVYAFWTSNPTYIVTFDSQDATTDANPTSKSVVSPAVNVGTLPIAPARTGYKFDGWFIKPNGEGDTFTANTIVNSNMTVYAKWNSYSYTVTFDSQGANVSANPTTKTVSSPATTVDSLPTAPEKNNYEFIGWYTGENGTGDRFTKNSVVSGNITVYAKWESYFTYTSYGNYVTITGLTTSGKKLASVTIPSEIGGKSVTGIDNAAFNSCNFTTIVLPNTLTSIKAGAFRSCSKLSSITIPSSVTKIESSAFASCTGLTNITIPNSVTSLGNNAFDGCSNLTSIIIGTGISSLEDGVFSCCSNLGSITIPDNIRNIGRNAFYRCTNLYRVIIGKGVTSIDSQAFSYCNALTNVTIPDSVILNFKTIFPSYTNIKTVAFSSGTTSIRENACSGYNWIVNLTIPDSVTSIGANAFNNCQSLSSIAIPSGVTSIGESAFSGCTGLASVKITDLVSWCGIEFGNHTANPLNSLGKPNLVLNSVTVTDMIIPSDVTNIGNYAFHGYQKLTSVTITNGVQGIGDNAFETCSNLTSISIPGSVISIGDNAFGYCIKLATVTMGNGIETIGDNAFINCTKLGTITIPNSVTEIGSGSFGDCGLSSITLSNNLSNITANLLENCDGLDEIIIPASVTNINVSAFFGCTEISYVTMQSIEPPTIEGGGIFHSSTHLRTVYVPQASVSKYTTALSGKLPNNNPTVTIVGY